MLTIPAVLRDAYRSAPDKTAIEEKGRPIAYRELYENVSKLAGALSAIGAGKGTKAILMMENGAEYIYAFYALASLGCIVVPMDRNMKNELPRAAEETGAELLFVTGGLTDQEQAQIKPIRSLRHVIVSGKHNERPDFISFERLLSQGRGDLQDYVGLVQEGDLACISFTSGTVSKPKGVMLTHYTLVFNSRELGNALNASEHDIFFNILPLFHTYGISINLLLPVILKTTVVLHGSLSLREVVQELNRTGATIFACIPVMYEKMKKVLDAEKPRTVQKFISSAAPLPYSLVQYYKEKLDIAIINIYGSSEANTTAIQYDCYNAPKYSVGRLLPSFEAKITDEAGEPLPRGEEGEIMLRTPKMMQGYYRMPEQTAAVLRDGWYRTGDIGYVSEDGQLFITGRKKDMFIVGGKKVFRQDIEEIIMSCGHVQEVRVRAEHDPSRGDELIAEIVPKEGAELTEADVLTYCRSIAAPHKVPRRIVFRSALEQTASWKKTFV
ncbi:class I adenylate-forming enzyme family protein [Paenibacillus thailandensis]|uniref:Class I adenylate-forming enzyme family protein n=1 Tax=Paenibacillus thailandensis TaxID=393250 RepID=A0ABW5R3T3_9BACL